MTAALPGARDETTFGARLKRYRVAAGLSQEALAERAGLSARAISAYERGLRQAPYRDTLRLLARALDLSPRETATLEAMVSRRRGPKRTTDIIESAVELPHPSAPGRSNLPAQVTSFVGRQRDILNVIQLLEQTRLLTLIGTGGCGKTRLALQAAGKLVDAYRDGIWFVDLAPLADPSLVPQAVAAAVGVREEPGQPLRVTLLAALRPRQPLLVLDNCEHVLNGCSHLADALLQACPDLQILATSRQPLGVTGEVTRRVPSLTAPASGQHSLTKDLIQYEAVQLFVDRARAVRPGFAVGSQNGPALARICWRLDGIPLAIELAAARVRVLTVEQIAQRMDDRFWSLIGGARTALPRQQTFRATLDWSHALLAEPEQALFRRLAIFVGSFDLDAAEAVSASEDILDLLAELVDKSLVVVEEDAGEARYRLLETIRQYGREKLLESGEADAVRTRYREWYRALVERAEPELSGPRQSLRLDHLEREHDNIRAVLEGGAVDPTWLEEGLRMAAALLRLWVVRGYLGEGRHLVAALMAASDAAPGVRRTRAWMVALRAAGFTAYFQGDYAAMASLGAEWLALAGELGDEWGLWLARDMLARVAMNQGDYPRALRLRGRACRDAPTG